MDPAVRRFAESVAQQHACLRTLMADVLAATGRPRQAAWEEFRRYLAAHVAAERLLMHPLFRSQDWEDPEVTCRLAEEEEIIRAVCALESLEQADCEAFTVSFPVLVGDLTAHMRLEETIELKGYLHRITEDDAEELITVLDLVDSVAAAARYVVPVCGSFGALVESAELELERLLTPPSDSMQPPDIRAGQGFFDR
jgi:hypothetical protein